ncbi:SAM-dependent methyltransferase [Terrabacter sp. Ter38]|uniref:SAM-dependent methyltransferase n=1 Tax=Terrabacter sp. Ter38 TaxID=2926030 RepID=UPI0021198B70|nr:SAM-dependent methyltransferase [Terrabacter sp. Ter38]
MDPLPWSEAWHEALYAAEQGFYVTRGGPAAHFTTAAHGPTGRVLAEALLALWAAEHGPALPSVVVDVGAGRGELATHLVDALELLGSRCAATPESEESPRPSDADSRSRDATAPGRDESPRPRVVAVDVVDRPEGLDDRVEWVRSPGGSALPPELTGLRSALVIAHEWLDVVPCTVAEVDADGVLHEVLVEPTTGVESLGPLLRDADRRWAEAHWPTRTPGDRVEVGLARDEAWAELVCRVEDGTLVAVDYGHTATGRPSGGTLTAYASGRLTTPVPDGSCDVTAHVAMDTLDADQVLTQREALQALGLSGTTPPHAVASTDPLGYLAALERASLEARLLAADGFGGFRWAVKRVRGHDVT